MKILDTRGCEFGYELIMVLPHAYYLHTQGAKFRVITCEGMEPFYYFLQKDQLQVYYTKRQGTLPVGVPLKTIHFDFLDKKEWLFPPLKQTYKKTTQLEGLFSKEPLLINNKYTMEWGHNPVNYLPLEVLQELLEYLTKKYTVIYNRPKPKSIVEDHSNTLTLDDYSLIQQNFSEVLDMNTLHRELEIPYNTLQLLVGSQASKFISVQGGNSILNSLFGGVNLVYAKQGGEIRHNSFQNWYKEFSGCTVIDTPNYQELIELTKKHF